jgi:hypothetical protein
MNGRGKTFIIKNETKNTSPMLTLCIAVIRWTANKTARRRRAALKRFSTPPSKLGRSNAEFTKLAHKSTHPKINLGISKR